jgi:hypothetical protein
VSINPTAVARLLDAIPLVASEADRDERFPAPDLHQRVQRRDTGCIQRWNGAEWVDLLCPGTGGTDGLVTTEELQAVVDDLTALEVRVQTLEDAGGGGGGDGSCPVYCGTGSPEGVVTAAVGALYYQRDAASTTHPQWVKRTGTGTTGWTAYAGHRGAGTESLAIGDNSAAAGAYGLAIGKSAVATSADGIALGKGAQAVEFGDIAIGRDAYAEGDDWDPYDPAQAAAEPFRWTNIAIGWQSTTLFGNGSVAIGHKAQLLNSADTYTGVDGWTYSDTDTGSFTVCIGSEARAGGDCTVAVGHRALTVRDHAVAVGPHARAGNTGTTALGRYAVTDAVDSIAIGHQSKTGATHVASVAIGVQAQTTAAHQLMLGGPSSGTQHVTAVRFNNATSDALTVNTDGTLATVNLLGTAIADLAGGATLSDVITTVNTVLARLRTLKILAP